jgi:hypothetical protein
MDDRALLKAPKKDEPISTITPTRVATPQARAHLKSLRPSSPPALPIPEDPPSSAPTRVETPGAIIRRTPQSAADEAARADATPPLDPDVGLTVPADILSPFVTGGALRPPTVDPAGGAMPRPGAMDGKPPAGAMTGPHIPPPVPLPAVPPSARAYLYGEVPAPAPILPSIFDSDRYPVHREPAMASGAVPAQNSGDMPLGPRPDGSFDPLAGEAATNRGLVASRQQSVRPRPAAPRIALWVAIATGTFITLGAAGFALYRQHAVQANAPETDRSVAEGASPTTSSPAEDDEPAPWTSATPLPAVDDRRPAPSASVSASAASSVSAPAPQRGRGETDKPPPEIRSPFE